MTMEPEASLLEDLQALLDRGLVRVDDTVQDGQVRVGVTARGRHEATTATAGDDLSPPAYQPLRLVDKPRSDRSDPNCA